MTRPGACLLFSQSVVNAMGTPFRVKGCWGLVLIALMASCQARSPSSAQSIALQPLFSGYPPALLPKLTPPPSPEAKAEAATFRARGINLRNQGQMEAAIAALVNAVDLDPTALDGYVILGWTQHLNDQRSAAIETLNAALQQESDYVPALNALGIVYLVDGQLEAAVTTHRQAQSLSPENEIAAYNLSLAYQRLREFEQAIAQAQLATDLEPQNPHKWVALAIAHHSNSEFELAQQAYAQAVQLDSRYRDRGFLSHLEQAGFSAEQIELTAEVASLNSSGLRQ